MVRKKGRIELLPQGVNRGIDCKILLFLTMLTYSVSYITLSENAFFAVLPYNVSYLTLSENVVFAVLPYTVSYITL